MFSKSIKQTRLKQLKISKPFDHNRIQARLSYPYVILFETEKSIRVVNLLNKDQDATSTEVFCFENNIRSFIIHDQKLWLALDSSELIIIDVTKGLQIKIIINNYANYKICHFVTEGKHLFLISESGERLATPFADEDLNLKFDNGVTEQLVTLEKSSTLLNNCVIKKECTFSNGLNIYLIEERVAGIRCPVTGVVDFISANTNMDYIVPWDDMAVVGNKSKMSVLNFAECNITYDFEDNGLYYCPLESYNQVFYFLLWSTEEVLIYNALLSQSDTPPDCDMAVTKPTFSTQESLKSQLRAKFEEAIQEVNPQVELITELKTLFSNITDYNFLIKMATELCKNNLIYKSVLFQIQKQVYATEDNYIMKLFSDTMIKIDLLEYIFFRGINYYDNNLFHLNVIELCVAFISKSDLDLASICWLKYSEIKLAVSVDDIVNILNAIPINVKMGALIVWLRNFIPPLLQENPFHIDLFVKWTTDRVFLLEQSTYWPKIGLKFIGEISNVLEGSLKMIPLRPISIDDLDVLKDHINYIMELKDKHKVNMLLSELSSLSPTEIALIMLRRCYTEDLEEFLQSTLPSYAARYQFELDDTLRSFVESEATSSRGCVDGHRLQILLNAFRSPTNKLECLLQVLKVLEVPWNDTVLKIASEAAASVSTDFTVTDADRTIAQEIYIELNYAKIKVILKKYNFPSSFNNYILVIHKIVNASTVDLNDLKVITTVVSAYAHHAHLMYIDKCLQTCDTQIALDYYNNLPNNDRKVLLRAIVNKFNLIISRGVKDPMTERNYLDLLKGTKCVDDKLMSELENMYHLKNSYNITLTLNNICTEKVRNEVASNWEQQDTTTASSGRGRHVHKLLGKSSSRNSNLLALLYQMSSESEVRDFVERFILWNLKNPDDLSILVKFKDGNNSEILVDACDVLSQLIFNCDEEHLHYLIERLGILSSLINSNITMTNLSVAWRFNYLYLPMSSVPALNDLIDFYVNTAKNNELDLANISVKSDFLPIRMIGHIMSRSSHFQLSDDFFKIRIKICKKLLAKVVAAQELDQLLVTSLLLIMCESEITDDNSWILDLLRGQSDSISPVAMHYLSSPLIRHTFELNNIIPGGNMSYPPQYLLKTKFNINLAEIALPENTEETWDVKILLFYILRQFPNTSIERLSDLCETLNVSLNDGLSLLLISVLSSWNLKYKIYSDNIGRRQLLLDNDANELLSKCLTVWDSIKTKDFIKDILSDFWKNGEVTLHGCLVSINPYYYEVYLCIYCLIFNSTTDTRKTKEYLLLNFLKDYKRKGAPRQYEFELFSVKGIFPELGHYRLPFHLFMRDDMWSNLKSEITLETYEYWLPIVPLLSLDSDLQIAKDMICSNAVKQTMTSRKQQEATDLDPKEREPWRLVSREEPLLRTAHRCVKHIANMEWAGACLFYVLQGCARGADQVAAAQLCFQFSQRWAAVQPGNRAVQQMERLHSSLSTRHALHKIDWAREELIKLSTEPAQLIHALYLHPQFVDKVTRHDVNRAANEIAEKNNINISSIRIQILENILLKNNSSFGLANKDLIIAKYILKATCPKMGAIYLSRIAFDDDSDFNKCKKLRALQCLMSVIDPDTAVKVTNREREALWTSLLDLLIIVNLEKIDMPYVVSTFIQDKNLAINHLTDVANGNVEGLKVAAKLAHMYGNIKAVRNLIPPLLNAALYEEMSPLLLQLPYPPDSVICTAWRAVILNPFQRADYPITERQKANCLTALNLLPICPVINDEDLVEIWKNCMRCKCLGLGCLVLPYMTAQKRQTLTELHKIDKRNLIISLKNLQADTYLVSGAMYVIENMSKKHGCYKR